MVMIQNAEWCTRMIVGLTGQLFVAMTEHLRAKGGSFFCLMVSVPHMLTALFWHRGKAEIWQNGTVGMEEGASSHSHAHKEVTEALR